MKEELWTQEGLTRVLIYLLEHDGENQKTIAKNTRVSTTSMNKIQLQLEHGELIKTERARKNNQTLYHITPKGKAIAKQFLEIYRLLEVKSESFLNNTVDH